MKLDCSLPLLDAMGFHFELFEDMLLVLYWVCAHVGFIASLNNCIKLLVLTLEHGLKRLWQLHLLLELLILLLSQERRLDLLLEVFKRP